ncbi:hypothetical protein CRENBAI_004700 [Crenichthys baileyi]|uniref:Uncharacterized protein n=1 Tax=Crenichthys baileyi TaxID=28760 RepID=A0AAV9R7I9_9TELE
MNHLSQHAGKKTGNCEAEYLTLQVGLDEFTEVTFLVFFSSWIYVSKQFFGCGSKNLVPISCKTFILYLLNPQFSGLSDGLSDKLVLSDKIFRNMLFITSSLSQCNNWFLLLGLDLWRKNRIKHCDSQDIFPRLGSGWLTLNIAAMFHCDH